MLITGSSHASPATLRVSTPYGDPRAGGKDSANSKRFPNNNGQKVIREQMQNEPGVLSSVACVAPGDVTVAAVLSTV